MERLINFDPQWINDIVITGINIFILFFVMSYFLFNPAREVLEKRRKRIAGDLETAKTSREDALALKAEYEDKIKSIDKEAQEILDAARKKAKKQEADILAEAREEANRIVDRANREIELEKKKALEDMKTEIVSIASLMAEKAVAASMDVKIQDSLIEETLKEMGEHMAKLVSKVYGDALFEAAMERDMLSPVYEEVQSLQTILMENADLVQFLNHPQIIKEEKLKVVENIFKGRVSDDLMGFLETVIEKGRQKELPKILDYFVNRVKEYKKIGIVTVTSAVELSAEQKAHTEAKLLETTAFVSLEVTYSVDPAILGGLVIRIGDRVVDSSIRTRLGEIRRDLMKLQLA